ncbi:hypothetical protein LY76DRAFT_674997 [Colletotrichum caudatum]|nr:hypothetical protein LY76DRAFT_674997 [Colletotrichum caudatum]
MVFLSSFYNTFGYFNLAKPDQHISAGRQLTAHLDGLRGVAAMCVYTMHLSMALDHNTLLGYTAGVSDIWYNYPVLRLFRSGKAMVRIFFVLSGYALSVSPSKHYGRPSDAGKLHHALATAMLKRPFRLFFPPLVTTSVIMIFAAAGLFPTAESMEALPAHLPAQTIVLKSSFLEQCADWLGFVTHKLINPWAWAEDLYVEEHDSYYGAHLWTIQTEFRCSLILFSVLAAASVLRGAFARQTLVGFLTVYYVAWGRWDAALFLSGMQLCLSEKALTLSRGTSTTTSNAWMRGRGPLPFVRSAALRALPLLVFLSGLWALSYPDDRAEQAFGFGLASWVFPSADVWQSLGAIAVVWSVSKVRMVRNSLYSTPLQYLGAISFSLYLVHYPYLEMGGWWLQLLCRDYVAGALSALGAESGLSGLAGNISGFLLVTAGLLCLADVTMRMVDEPSQVLLRWLVRWSCFENPGGSSCLSVDQ